MEAEEQAPGRPGWTAVVGEFDTGGAGIAAELTRNRGVASLMTLGWGISLYEP